MWIFYTLFYGLMKGAREVVKKKAMIKNTFFEVLLVYTGLSFLMIIPTAGDAGLMDYKFFPYILIKSFVIFLAWLLSFYALNKLPVSLYGILDLSRVMFATLLGVFVLGEIMTINQYIGLILVCLGLILLKYLPLLGKIKSENEEIKTKYVIMALSSCVLNAISGLLDKILMADISSSQLQFWYMMFLFIFYLIYATITKSKITLGVFKNGWVWLMAIMFVLSDKALFIANASPESKITMMTLIKQSGCIVTIIAGKYVFKEKNITRKLICAGVIVAGIVIGVM